VTPEGMLLNIERLARKAERRMSESWINKALGKEVKVEIPQTTKSQILSRMKEIQMMPDGPAKTEAIRRVIDMAAVHFPPTASELIDAYRYQNMLSNPLTHLRN